DPTLHLNDQLSLTWYTGWRGLNLYEILADWTVTAAAASGAHHIVFLGSSGGGFAALQVASIVPGSIAVPINPQTTIWRYQPGGSLSFVRSYLEHVAPYLIPEKGLRSISADDDWSAPLGDTASTIMTY